MNISIDSREKGRRFRAAKHYEDKGHDTSVKSLDVGDYVFDRHRFLIFIMSWCRVI